MTWIITCVRDWLSCDTIGAKSGLLDRGRREHLDKDDPLTRCIHKAMVGVIITL